MFTYYIAGDIDNINFKFLENGLRERGWEKAKDNDKNISFVYVLALNKHNKSGIECVLKNMIDESKGVKQISDKFLFDIYLFFKYFFGFIFIIAMFIFFIVIIMMSFALIFF